MALEVLRYEGNDRVREAFGISAAFSVMAIAFLALGPQIVAGGEFESLSEELPAVFVEAFGFESLGSIEGLLASEFYTLFWLLFFGIYLAYSAAGSIAGDIETNEMDTLLSTPVSRTSVLFEKFLSLLVPIVIANLVVPSVIYLGAGMVGESVSLADLAVLHGLSIPYLFCCGAIGLVLSVSLADKDTAQNAALGVLFALFMLQSLVVSTDVEWLGNLAPMAYIDPNEILVEGTYDLAGGAVLLVVAVVLVVVSQLRFTRMDIQ